MLRYQPRRRKPAKPWTTLIMLLSLLFLLIYIKVDMKNKGTFYRMLTGPEVKTRSAEFIMPESLRQHSPARDSLAAVSSVKKKALMP